jgi:predicted transcriptional regulator
MPYEEVRDFFYARHNHIAALDDAAERLHGLAGLSAGTVQAGLAAYMMDRHGVRLALDGAQDAAGAQRRYDPASKVLHLSPHLRPGQQAFQMATQLAFMEADGTLRHLVDAASFSSDEARALARIGLANYFAGALVLPYTAFLDAAESMRYDIERLGRRFGVGYETVCHRLSTLQRPQARGVPFFFVRVDRAGNISKRQSATDFHFSRVGGTCPLWNVYEAFARPGRILTQLAQMPDGRTYLWVARTVTRSHGEYGAPDKTFSIGLGCDLRHASRLVYAKGLDLGDARVATPIGAGCKVCERPACPQRAFPPVGRTLAIDENRSRFAPYPVRG